MRLSLALTSGLLSLAIVTPAVAQGFRSASILEGISEDMYTASEEVNVNVPVQGDAFLAGGVVHIDARIGSDLNVAGGQVFINEFVGDDLRIVGGDVTVTSQVNGDLIVLGGSVKVLQSAQILGNVYVRGGEVRIDGRVSKTADIIGGAVFINGTINDDLRVHGDSISLNGTVRGNVTLTAQDMRFSPNAVVEGDVNYWMPTEIPEVDQIVSGQVNYDTSLMPTRFMKEAEGKAASFIGVILASFTIFSLLSSAIIIILLLAGTKTFFNDAADALMKQPWKYVGIGFLYFICLPVATLLLMMTVIGIPIALLLLAGLFFSLYFAKPLTAVVCAKWLEKRYANKKKPWGMLILFLVGLACYIVLKVLEVIPIVGWIIVAIVICGAFGAMTSAKWSRFKRVR